MFIGKSLLSQILNVTRTTWDYTSLATRILQCANPTESKLLHSDLITAGLDRDTFIGNHIVRMFGKLGKVQEANRAFDRIEQPNVFSWNMLLTAYAQNGYLQQAVELFEKMPQKDIVSWTSLITVFSQKNEPLQALHFFRRMLLSGLEPDRAALLGMLDACTFSEGKMVHEKAVHMGLICDVSVGTALINMYGRFKELEHAKYLFDQMSQRNVISWTAMLTAYAQNGHLQEGTSLFHKMPKQDVVSWNSIVSAHAQDGDHIEAFNLFKHMDIEGICPERSTFVSILDACANNAALVQGKLVHSSIVAWDVAVRNALINMYGKCGHLVYAKMIFDEMDYLRDVISWTSIISVHAQHGQSGLALELFHRMACEGIQPNEITLATILSACNYKGMINDGIYYFLCLHLEYGILATLNHYMWLIDVLGRCGQLDKAEGLLKNMPFEPRPLAWKMVLGACQTHQDLERAERLAEHLFSTHALHSAPYIVLSNMYVTKSQRSLCITTRI